MCHWNWAPRQPLWHCLLGSRLVACPPRHVVPWWPQNREFTPIFHSERSHACGRPNFLLIRLEASQVPHPISLQCADDKKLSAGSWWQSWETGGNSKGNGSKWKSRIVRTSRIILRVYWHSVRKCDKRWENCIFSVVPVDMMARRSSQLVGHLFCFSSPCVWRFRLNRLGGRSGGYFQFYLFPQLCLQKHDEQTTIIGTNLPSLLIDVSRFSEPLYPRHANWDISSRDGMYQNILFALQRIGLFTCFFNKFDFHK